MSERQEKAPPTQHALTVRTLTVAGAVVVGIAATVVSGGALKALGRMLAKR